MIDFFNEGDNECIVLDSVKGSTLRKMMLDCGKVRMNISLATNILSDILSILKKLHEYHILHNNITKDSVHGLKREKILIFRLFDFRNARFVNDQKANITVFKGF